MAWKNLLAHSSSTYSQLPQVNDEHIDSSDSEPLASIRAKTSSVKEVALDISAVENVNTGKVTFFLDQTRPIDYVLVYEVKRQEGDGGSPIDITQRESFFKEMEMLGVETEKTKAIQKSGHQTYFVKLHLPWDIIKDWAEKFHIRVPLQEAPGELTNWSHNVLEFFGTISKLNPMHCVVPFLPQHYYTAQFRADRLQYYIFNQEPEKLFTRQQRSYILSELLQSIRYGDEEQGEVGLQRLLDDGVFRAAFPLHDGPLQEDFRGKVYKQEEENNQRQILRDYWAGFFVFFRYQPIAHIRGYFGEQVALYFAWLGLYTAWLIPIAVVGIFAFLYGLLSIPDDPVVEDICENGEQYKMCPICDRCPYWELQQACSAKKLGYMFDNIGTCFNAFLLSLWAVLFVESWKTKNAQLTYFFDCDDYQEEEEHPRAEYSRAAPKIRRNAVTGQLEPYFYPTTLMLRRLASWIASISFVLIIFVVTFGVVLLRTAIAAKLTQDYGMESPYRKLANITAAVVNVVTILILNRVYVVIARKLTEWEMHRTQREHEDSLAWKAYWFQFVNTFAPMFYIAFLKGRFVGYPDHRRHMVGMLLESCDIGGCFAEVGFQLIITMCGKQIVSNFVEFTLPSLIHYIRGRTSKLHSNTELNATFLDQQHKLVPFEGLTNEYMEMVIQFGFIVLFGAAFPLAAMFSLLNNIFEIRLDARKLVVQSRRPLARRAQSIGIWILVLRWMTLLSVWVNAFLIAFTSEALTLILYAAQNSGSTKGYTNYTLATAPHDTMHESCRYEDFRDRKGFLNKFHYELAVLRLSFILCYVGLTYFIRGVISSLIPDSPKVVQDARKRRRFLATQALQSSPAAANEAYARVRTSTQVNPLALTRIGGKSSKIRSRNLRRDVRSLPETTQTNLTVENDRTWHSVPELPPDRGKEGV